ncbi:fatty acid desaturase [Granulosicoccaceae sp. 1_MG-2023]|nr:fatty acid desaturase [Granulosicoccaceae sp. 1_MG-2023]
MILAISALDFFLYLTIDSAAVLAGYWVLMLVPKGKICAWNHHHQHTPTFRSDGMNRVLEFFYALHTGVTTHLWLLHHVFGHHKNYLDQRRDESRWQNADGSTMGEIAYTLEVAGTAYYRGYKVGRKYPKFLPVFVFYTALTFVLTAALVWFRPVPAMFLFVLPMVCGLLLTAWATYDHHRDLSTTDKFAASRNNLNRFYNITTGNLGYHTAHHYKHGVHWSKLPALHEQIKDRIPPGLISSSAL